MENKKYLVKKSLVVEYVVYEAIYANSKEEALKKAKVDTDIQEIEKKWDKPKKLTTNVISIRKG